MHNHTSIVMAVTAMPVSTGKHSPFTDTLVAEVAAIRPSDPLDSLGQSVQLVGTSHHNTWQTPLAVTACWGLAGLLLVVIHQAPTRSLYTVE